MQIENPQTSTINQDFIKAKYVRNYQEVVQARWDYGCMYMIPTRKFSRSCHSLTISVFRRRFTKKEEEEEEKEKKAAEAEIETETEEEHLEERYGDDGVEC